MLVMCTISHLACNKLPKNAFLAQTTATVGDATGANFSIVERVDEQGEEIIFNICISVAKNLTSASRLLRI